MKRNIKSTQTFTGTQDFEAYRNAESYCYDNGYSVGSMCAPQPTAIKKGNYDIAKWRNLSQTDKNNIDGTITTDSDYRNGTITVTIYE